MAVVINYCSFIKREQFTCSNCVGAHYQSFRLWSLRDNFYNEHINYFNYAISTCSLFILYEWILSIYAVKMSIINCFFIISPSYTNRLYASGVNVRSCFFQLLSEIKVELICLELPKV